MQILVYIILFISSVHAPCCIHYAKQTNTIMKCIYMQISRRTLVRCLHFEKSVNFLIDILPYSRTKWKINRRNNRKKIVSIEKFIKRANLILFLLSRHRTIEFQCHLIDYEQQQQRGQQTAECHFDSEKHPSDFW